ncbi:hypothetical protein SDC9_211859 [bioreactor metagenome]|uniref:Uncharacterized protein n=1 Tax=bioreactor metagenome TaxID=1076179 RepID=A0A645JK89_9ZZZZ
MFENVREIPYWVLEEMLDKQADVVVAAQRRTADSMLEGPFNKRAVRAAIKKGKTKRRKDGLVKYVTFNGSQHGSRLAEIAFINEYGKKGQSARPFVKVANEGAAGESQIAAEKVFDDWIETI